MTADQSESLPKLLIHSEVRKYLWRLGAPTGILATLAALAVGYGGFLHKEASIKSQVAETREKEAQDSAARLLDISDKAFNQVFGQTAELNKKISETTMLLMDKLGPVEAAAARAEVLVGAAEKEVSRMERITSNAVEQASDAQTASRKAKTAIVEFEATMAAAKQVSGFVNNLDLKQACWESETHYSYIS